MEGTQKYKHTIHWVLKQVPIVLSEFRKMCIKFEFLARKVEMEWKNSKPYISGENQNRFELSKPSLLSTVMVILLLLVLLLLGWCCCILNFDGFLIVLEFLWKFWWIFEFWWILGFWWQLEWVWTTFQFHSLCSSYVTPFALLCNCGTAVGRYIKWSFTYVLLRCFFRHSEPSSIDFFGYFGTIVFKLVLLSFYCFILEAFLGL